MGFNILKTRRGKLEAKIRTELNSNTPNIDKILVAIDDYEKSNLDTIEKLRKNKVYDTKRINGALKSTIKAHGPITKLLIGSATKRIHGALLDTTSKPIPSEPINKLDLKEKKLILKTNWIMFEVIVWVTLLLYFLCK